jgi:predicted GNAT family acetyltransferase
MSDTTATDNTGLHRFEVTDEGHTAELVYSVEGDRLRLVHTGVPEELGGRGIGGVLVQAAVDRAVAEGLTIVPDCPFARGWLEKHPDEAGRATIAW